MLELEGRANTSEAAVRVLQICREHDVIDLWQHLLSHQGYSEITPSGGMHVMYRILDREVPNNEKIATRPAHESEYTEQEKQIREQQPDWTPIRVLVETRGEGGYVIVAPTPGTCHQSGQAWITRNGIPGEFPTITWAERCKLHNALREALHVPLSRELVIQADRLPAPKPERQPGAPPSVAEDFNARASWSDSWFLEQGWQIHHREGSEVFWTRPGKDLAEGHSASTGYRDGEQDCLYVWSTATSLPSQVPLTKFMVFAHYRFHDDRSAAARALRRQGYGPPVHPPLPEFQPFDIGWEPDLQADRAPAAGELPVEPTDESQAMVPVAPRGIQPHELNVVRTDISGGWVLSDTGYAMRLKDVYQNQVRYNSTDNTWYRWEPDTGSWLKDSYRFVDTAAQRIAIDSYNWLKQFQAAFVSDSNEKAINNLLKQAQAALNHNRLDAIVKRLRTLDGVATTSTDFDANMDLLNLRNGTLNLATYELKAHSPDDMLMLQFHADYDPDATCPSFFKYLMDVFPDEQVRSYIQRALGYSLLGRPDERALFLLHGPSGTGKSVFTDVMTHLFGDYGTTAPSSAFKIRRQESTVDLHQLRGKRFVASSEMPEGAQLDEELVKRITGGDQIASRGLYEKFILWRPQCVIWIGTNHLPKLNSDDDAIWRRIRTIPMPTIIRFSGKEEVKGYARYLIQEASGILNWILDGLREYRRLGRLAEPPTVNEDIAKYRVDNDTVASWLYDGIESGALSMDNAAASITVSSAYINYSSYCDNDGIRPYGKKRFINRLQAINSTLFKEKRGGQQVIVGLKQISSS